jgi:alpha-tubulin suppressor-like RCC1 family protein
MKHHPRSLILWTSLLLPIGLQFACGSEKNPTKNKVGPSSFAPGFDDANAGVGKLGLVPRVELGPTRYANKEILLDAASSDAVSWSWEQLAGPGVVTFSSPDTEDTSVTANRDGFYWIRLTVKSTDGTETYDDVQLLWDTVAPCPTLTSEVKAFRPTSVDGHVPADATQIEWKQLSGPGVIRFSNAAASETEISADIDGTYGIRLTATDKVGNVCASDLSFIWQTTVPAVALGPDIFTNKEVLIDAATAEAGSFAWTMVSGPGTIRFSEPSKEDTRVSADTDGDYVLRLTIMTSTGLMAFDELTLHWDSAAPVVSLGQDLDRKYRAIIDAQTSGAQTYLWRKVSGPGRITFASIDTEDTALISDQAGAYEIALTVTDLAGNSATDSIRINFDYDVRVFAKELSSGGSHTCAILDDESVACWGYNYSQELGYGDQNKFGEGMDRYAPPSFPINLGPSKTARHISVNYAHSCAILNDGSVKCWGQNASGQLGYGDSKKLGVPAATAIALGGRARDIATGLSHTCAILEDGSVKCWGAGSAGQLGYGDYLSRTSPPPTPIELGSGRSAKALSLGAYHSCALLDDESVKCWGNNGNGQLGLLDKNYRNKPDEAVQLPNGLRARSITAGAYHVCAVLTDANTLCWGRGKQGQLGYGDLNDRLITEALVYPFQGRRVAKMVAGLSHTCALFDNHEVQCWGANDEAQLGTGAHPALITATAAESVGFGGGSVKDLSAGRLHTCALLDDSTLKCWGSNSYGQLGAGKTYSESTPPGKVVTYGD